MAIRSIQAHRLTQPDATEQSHTPVIRVQGLSHAYGSRNILHDITFQVQTGEWVGVIGPNGGGKSTLMSLLSRAEHVQQGTIELNGLSLGAYKKKQLSRLMAVQLQDVLPDVHFTVKDIVEMGRFPYQSWFGGEREDSSLFIDQIMERLQLHDIADSPLHQLSGGQRQRASLGKLMAQAPSIVLLDEPTTYLDIHYQVQFMDYMREWQQDCGLTIVSVLHDLNLAALYCDRIIIMHDGTIVGDGTPDEMLTPERIESTFQTSAVVVSHPECGRPQVLITRGQK